MRKNKLIQLRKLRNHREDMLMKTYPNNSFHKKVCKQPSQVSHIISISPIMPPKKHVLHSHIQ